LKIALKCSVGYETCQVLVYFFLKKMKKELEMC